MCACDSFFFWLGWSWFLWGLLSSCSEEGAALYLWCMGFSLHWLLIAESQALRDPGFNSSSVWIQQLRPWSLEHGLSSWASQVALVVKNPSASAGDMRCGFSPWVGKIPWRRAWQSTPVTCLENPMARGAWWTIGRRVTKSWTSLKWLRMAHQYCVWYKTL